MWESQNEARGNFDHKDFHEFGHRPQKNVGNKKTPL